jgi:hypothetical protein
MPTCTTSPVPSTLVPDSGGAPLATIQDSPGMDLGIDLVTPMAIPIMVTLLADLLPILVGKASVLRLHRMHHHECSSEGSRRDRVQWWLFIDTFSKPMVASPLRAV